MAQSNKKPKEPKLNHKDFTAHDEAEARKLAQAHLDNLPDDPEVVRTEIRGPWDHVTRDRIDHGKTVQAIWWTEQS